MECLEFSPEWFDESSKAWRANKKRVGQSWKYVCSVDLCKKVSKSAFASLSFLQPSVCPQILGEHLCSKHISNFLSGKSASLPTLALLSPSEGVAQQKEPLPRRHSPRLLPLSSKPANLQGTSPSTRTSQRLRRAESQVVPPGQAVSHRAVRKLRATPSQ